MTPAKQPLLHLENAVQGLLDLLGILERLLALLGQRLDGLFQLLADRLRDRLDPIPVHLLEAPELLVGGAQHAMEGVPAIVLATDLRLQLLDRRVRSVNHPYYLGYPH